MLKDIISVGKAERRRHIGEDRMIKKQIAVHDGVVVARTYEDKNLWDFGLIFEDISYVAKILGRRPPPFITRNSYTVIRKMVEKVYKGEALEWRDANWNM